VGSEGFYEEEGPVRPVTVSTIWIDRYDVINSQFARFVAATGYVTDAERKPDPTDYPDIPPEKLAAGGAVFMQRKEDSGHRIIRPNRLGTGGCAAGA
jgi:formylglycine-generating enzyme required for sulfatase activity